MLKSYKHYNFSNSTYRHMSFRFYVYFFENGPMNSNKFYNAQVSFLK